MLVWGLLACAYPFIDQFASDASPLPVMQHLAIYLALGGVGFLLCAALAWYFLDQGKTLPAIMLLAAGSLWGVSMASLGHNSFGQLKSSKGLVEQIDVYKRQRQLQRRSGNPSLCPA